MHDAQQVIASLEAFRNMGVRLSVDDFGTGYSSLSYLKRFPVDRLKIDQSFVRDLGADADDVAIAQAIITLGHTLNLRVIAEGVETPEQLAFLRQHQCDEMQGYLFGKPVPAQEFGTLLASGRTLAP
jgi:EAL domain-containing protein (putative c-di-GMP-specific phosphodiesterase class I)